MHKFFFGVFLMLLISGCLPAQKSIRKKGDNYFNAGKFREAVESYNNYKNILKEPAILIKRGISFYFTNNPDACISDMAAAHKLMSADPVRFKYSAKAYFAKKDYIEAARFYKLYLSLLKQNTSEWKQTINEIKKCGYAKNQKFASQLAFVENLGPNVNSVNDDFGPIQSPTMQGRYYFSSCREGATGGLRNDKGLADEVYGKFSSDMFLVDLKEGNWSAVLPFEQILNSPRHDILQDFSTDGSIIYFIKSADRKTGILYTDTFNLDRNPSAFPVPADIPFRAEKGDKDLFIFNDSLIIFASQKEEGFGGFDLYYARKTGMNWLPPVNLGNTINSEANETGPFLVRNGLKLFFYSDRTESLGGYDIFSSDFSPQNLWSNITNLKSPVNSPGDDVDFELSADGMSALFASDRIESIGGLDLYIAYLKEQVIEQLAFVDMPEFVYVSNKEGVNEVNSKVSEISEGELAPPRDFISKALYFRENEDLLNATNVAAIKKLAELMVIYPDLNVLICSHYVSEGRPDYDLYFSIKRAEKVAESLINYGISSQRIIMQGCGANYPVALPSINGIPSSLADKVNRRIDISILNNKVSNLKIVHESPIVAAQYRDTTWDNFTEANKGVTFRVRFSKVSQMLKSDVLSMHHDAIIEKTGNEEQYTYTMGNFANYNEARLLKSELIQNNMTEAVIIPYYEGIEINPDKIPSLLNKYPELEKYLKME